MKHRIWELDALRGIGILVMMFIHLMYDLVELYGIVQWHYPLWFRIIGNVGGLFLVLSGLCATLGRHTVRRGLTVLGCGLIITVVTAGMYFFGFATKAIIIYFGVLHCLGVSMLLWCLFRRLPTWALAVLAVLMVASGLYLERVVLVDHLWLMPLGFTNGRLSTADYFPLLPCFGYFLLGAVIGRTVYRKKVTRFPAVNPNNLLSRPLCFIGRHSLAIYMLHQPILSALCLLL